MRPSIAVALTRRCPLVNRPRSSGTWDLRRGSRLDIFFTAERGILTSTSTKLRRPLLAPWMMDRDMTTPAEAVNALRAAHEAADAGHYSTIGSRFADAELVVRSHLAQRPDRPIAAFDILSDIILGRSPRRISSLA
jgi:hypothetical protein